MKLVNLKVVKEVVKEVIVEKEVVANPTLSTIITFPIGSAQLSKTERAKLGVFAKVIADNEVVNIVGSADTTTGTEARNSVLAAQRAEVVRNILINEYNIAPERINLSTEFDTNDEPTASRAAVLTLVVK